MFEYDISKCGRRLKTPFIVVFVLLNQQFSVQFFCISLFVLFPMAIVLCIHLRFATHDYPFGIISKILFFFSMFVRDRLFNLQGGYGFLFRSEIFFGQHESQNMFFFQNLALGYMTQTLNQIIFFPPPKSEYIFQQHWELEYCFLEKKP